MRSRVGGSRGGPTQVAVQLETEEDTTLQFESRFESGNLAKAVQVYVLFPVCVHFACLVVQATKNLKAALWSKAAFVSPVRFLWSFLDRARL